MWKSGFGGKRLDLDSFIHSFMVVRASKEARNEERGEEGYVPQQGRAGQRGRKKTEESINLPNAIYTPSQL